MKYFKVINDKYHVLCIVKAKDLIEGNKIAKNWYKDNFKLEEISSDELNYEALDTLQKEKMYFYKYKLSKEEINARFNIKPLKIGNLYYASFGDIGCYEQTDPYLEMYYFFKNKNVKIVKLHYRHMYCENAGNGTQHSEIDCWWEEIL